MGTLSTLGVDDIGIAWRFVEECEDEDPRTWGPDAVTAQAVRQRDGIFRSRPPAVDFASVAGRSVLDPEDLVLAGDVDEAEDLLIARIDRDRARDFDMMDESFDTAPWIRVAANDLPEDRHVARVLVPGPGVRRAGERGHLG